MNKVARILLNFLLPPGIAALLGIAGIALYATGQTDWGSTLLLIPYAYAFAAIPSLVHVAIMERYYLRGGMIVGTRTLRVSSVSGLFAGLLVFLCLFAVAGGSVLKLEVFWIYPVLGAATGAITALVILVLSILYKKAVRRTA
jgi:hypothetical protein